MKEISLTQGKAAIVDDDDYESINAHKWHYVNVGYASRYSGGGRKNRKTDYMHIAVMGKQSGMEIDHINGNKLDNRKENLRHVTHSQNMQNASVKGGSSRYKGVCWDKSRNKWISSIYISEKHVHIGRYESEEDAARAYNLRAHVAFGEFARTNYIQEEKQL